ncbi:porin family protein [Rickettsiales endosymbiont of Peranema trichophorum]|uniref:outer membrane protein n=1 Tax=Rickettsiales endosymbiont of Peranema trichophorum TaxID=2486577 RepID=UPI0010238729|nr:outer membrane beta-barrel protein [Rickettsiales endosymbiont of Peranema trichophorum]RZI47398.1 porin family protein [Rickettsiales endosymbiont of Peranema trichophorum]
MKKVTTLAMALCLVSSVGSAAAVGDYYVSAAFGGVKSGVKHKSGNVTSTIRATGLATTVTAGGAATVPANQGSADYNSTLSIPKSRDANSLMMEFAFGTYLMPNIRTEIALSYLQNKSKKQRFTNSISVAPTAPFVTRATHPNLGFGDAHIAAGGDVSTVGNTTITDPTTAVAARERAPDQTFRAGVNAKTLAIMLNAYYDIKMSEIASPYLMAGVGYGQTRYSLSGGAPNGDKPKKGKKSDFAFQVGAGVDFNVAEATTLGLGYRLRSGAGKVKKSGWEELQPSAKVAHVLLANVRFSF